MYIRKRTVGMKYKSYLQDLLTNFHNTEISYLEVDLVSIPHIFHVPILSIWYIDPSLELSSHTATHNSYFLIEHTKVSYSTTCTRSVLVLTVCSLSTL